MVHNGTEQTTPQMPHPTRNDKNEQLQTQKMPIKNIRPQLREMLPRRSCMRNLQGTITLPSRRP